MEEDMHMYGVYMDEVDSVFNQRAANGSTTEDGHATTNVRTRSKDLTPTQRQQIYEAFLERSVNGNLRKNTTNRVAELFNVHQSAVWQNWKRAKQCMIPEYQFILVLESLRILAEKRFKLTYHMFQQFHYAEGRL
jgi:predicted DNA-binding protein YlxM (UPF0122 family)